MKKNNLTIFMAMMVTVFILPFIISNIFYVDDIYRSVTGKGGWTGLGRPLADALFYLFRPEFGMVVDIAPLTQILSGLFLFIAWRVCSVVLFKKNNYITLLATFPIVASPFFVQNLAYRFDSMSMSVALLTACLSFYFIAQIITKRSVIISIAFGVASMCLYQSAINLFIGLSAVYILSRDSSDNKLIIKLSIFAAAFIVINLIYLLVINAAGINGSGRGAIYIWGAYKESIIYVDYFISSLGVSYYAASAIFLVPTLIAVMIKTRSNWMANHSYLSAIAILATPFVALISIFGALPLLAGQEPIPRILTGAAATFIYINASILILISSLSGETSIGRNASYILALQSIFFISVPYSFVNAQKKQDILDINVAYDAARDINLHFDISSETSVYPMGGTPSAHQVYVNSHQLPLIKEMVRSMYDFTAYSYLRDMNVRGIRMDFNRGNTMLKYKDGVTRAQKKIERKRYSIYQADNNIFVMFNDKW